MDILKRPMFFVAIATSLAVLISLYAYDFIYLFIVTAFLSLVFLCYKSGIKFITVTVAFLLFSFSLFGEYENIDRINALDGKTVKADFVVTAQPNEYEKFNTVFLKTTKSEDLPKNTKYFVFDYSKSDFLPGDVLTAEIKLSAIESDDEYRLYDYGNSVYATASLLKAEKSKQTNRFYRCCYNIRSYVKQKNSEFFGGDVGGLLVAITSGDKTLLSENFLTNVKTTGISHVIVVSGMHLSIIMTAIFTLTDRIFYNKYIRSLLSVLVVVIISGVCGFTMSVVRAGAMFVISAFAPIFNRESDSLNSLCIAVTLVLIGTPFAIVNISFQLSVLSTLAIIWAVPFYTNLLTKALKISSNILNTLIGVVLCSLFAMIFTMPIIIKTFGFVSVVAPLTNLVITYPVTIMLTLNVVALCISVIPFIKILSYPVFYISGLCSKFVVFAVNKIATLPITVAILPDGAFWFSLIPLFLIIFFMYFYEYKLKKKRCD